MDAGTVTLSTIIENVGSLTTAVTTMYTALSKYWFVFLPLSMTVFGFIFGSFKSLMMYRRRRRG